MNTNNIPSLALKRLRREFIQLCENPTEGIVAYPISDLQWLEWDCVIMGPEGSPYEYGFFEAKLQFPTDYPMSPPTLRFISPIWHPNVYYGGNRHGEVCISILHAGVDRFGYEQSNERWSPVQNVEKILLSVASMIAAPNPDSPANVEAAKMFRDEYSKFEKRVQEDVKRSLQL